MKKRFFGSRHLFHLLFFDRLYQRIVVQNIQVACLQDCCAWNKSNEQVWKILQGLLREC